MAAEYLSNPPSDTAATKVLNGSCLCGSVTYTITGPPTKNILCHCTSCKKASGSAFMANGFYEKSQFKLTSPATSVTTYKDTSPDSGGFVARSFCSICGSSVFVTSPRYEKAVVIMSGTLDSDALKEWAPQEEFYCKKRGPWLGAGGVAEEKKFEGMT